MEAAQANGPNGDYIDFLRKTIDDRDKEIAFLESKLSKYEKLLDKNLEDL